MKKRGKPTIGVDLAKGESYQKNVVISFAEWELSLTEKTCSQCEIDTKLEWEQATPLPPPTRHTKLK